MDNQQRYGGRVRRTNWTAHAHVDLAMHRATLGAVYAIVFFGVLEAVPATGQDTVSLPPAPHYFDLSEGRRSGNAPDAGWPARAADSPATRQDVFAGDGMQLPPVGAEIPQGLPAPNALTPSGPYEPRLAGTEPWTWQILPDGVIYPSYLAGPKEPRFASVWDHETHSGWAWDLEAGGRVALVRYGTQGTPRPDGWELDVEGAAFPRLDIEHDEDLTSADFRVGVPLTFGSGPFQVKLETYHLSSHLGDEYMLRVADYQRNNYSRNALVLGGSYYVTSDLRLYAEAEWAFYADGGSKPWEFQFGFDYSPLQAANRATGSPFVAINGHLREEVDYQGTLVVQAGWQWRGSSNHLSRLGVQYSVGKSDQYEFYNRNEEMVGIGLWYDF
jgi:hypothetical protein